LPKRNPIPVCRPWVATDFEFRYRSLILIAIYLLAFVLWPLDRHDVAGFLARALPPNVLSKQLGYLISALPAVLAACLGSWAYAYLGGDTPESLHPSTGTLVTGGPYRLLRHPLNLATILLLLSFGCPLNWIGFLLVTVATITFVYRLIRREEIDLVAAYGQRYQEYAESVPTLIPAVSPKMSSAETIPNWKNGVAGGVYLWLLAASMVVLAASLRESLFYATLAAGLVIRLASPRLGRAVSATG
jgi:protein-S-isoprenylcysteine O-methyltransferase Ste14